MTTPKVFISYSHDNDEHKAWVRRLAEQLRGNGVNAILDQWDLRLGGDLVSFMARGIDESMRVLMICTPGYVEKANEGRGGVGYERLVISGAIYENTDTTKFIPIVRVKGTALPIFLGPRLFLDFSDDDTYQKSLDALLREIHDAPHHPKPPIEPFRAAGRLDPSTGAAGTATRTPSSAQVSPNAAPSPGVWRVGLRAFWLRHTNPKEYCRRQYDVRMGEFAERRQSIAFSIAEVQKLKYLHESKAKAADDWVRRAERAEADGRPDLAAKAGERREEVLAEAREAQATLESANGLLVAQELKVRAEGRLLNHTLALAMKHAAVLDGIQPDQARREYRRIGDLLHHPNWPQLGREVH